jgi:Protein of unknown function (DUF3179)
MSEPQADLLDHQTKQAPVSGGVYWTPMKLAVGLLMGVFAFGVVVYVQWDEIERISQGGGGDGGARRSGFVYRMAEESGPAFDMDGLLIPLERVLSGGPAKDGIPSLTNPKTAGVTDADFMLDDDRVVGVEVNGERRAYPIKVLNFHECYNDVLGGVPIAVMFCPLCDSVSVVDRRLDGKTYEFGISGLLYNSNVLLYDRTDDALWSQVGMMAVSGPNAGRSLKHLVGWEVTTFSSWRGAYPESTVATLETGHYTSGFYDVVAYAEYFENDEVMFPVEPRDGRFANKTPVVGVLVDGEAKAYLVETIGRAPGGRVEDMVGGERVVLEAVDGGVRFVEVPEGGKALTTFWFAWYAFHPGTGVYELGEVLDGKPSPDG